MLAGLLALVACFGEDVLTETTPTPNPVMVAFGRGYCQNDYIRGWDGKGIGSQDACNALCLAEADCIYASFEIGKTCSRYNGESCALNGMTSYYTFKKTHKAAPVFPHPPTCTPTSAPTARTVAPTPSPTKCQDFNAQWCGVMQDLQNACYEDDWEAFRKKCPVTCKLHGVTSLCPGQVPSLAPTEVAPAGIQSSAPTPAPTPAPSACEEIDVQVFGRRVTRRTVFGSWFFTLLLIVLLVIQNQRLRMRLQRNNRGGLALQDSLVAKTAGETNGGAQSAV